MIRHFCCDERRREAVRDEGIGNGIEFLEVADGPGVPEADRQRLLRVHFVRAPSPALQAIAADQVRITGGIRVTGIRVVSVAFDGDVLVVGVDRPGDFSRYTLTLGEPGGAPVTDLDPVLDAVEFSFKVECPGGFDCTTECRCAPEPVDEPEIDYLALDFTSFRQLMLDRMAVTAPGWRERNPADLGVALVELLAYAADHVGYQLDATGMEASLATARRRSSVRRHARLVDYRMHDGSNARTWVHVEVADGAGGVTLPQHTQLLTRVPTLPHRLVAPSPEYTAALAAAPAVFETMEERTVRDTLNRFELYAWGDRECCLPAGATSASLRGRHEDLRKGDVLVFIEQRGPRSGNPADADLEHRHAVRLDEDPAFTTDPLFDDPDEPGMRQAVTDIAWAAEDALPFSLCISATDENGAFHGDISVALGNIVLADHGRSRSEHLPEVPDADPRLAYPPEPVACEPGRDEGRPARFAPALREPEPSMTGTLGRALQGEDQRRPARFDPAAPASAAFVWQPRHVLPDAEFVDQDTGQEWVPRRDLLASDAFAPEFVVETETGGLARVRFGDGEYGLRPRPRSRLTARYRTGNGTAGNVGADTLWHVVTSFGGISSIRNPLPARGGTDPEPLDRVRQDAPVAFRVPERAVTPADYAAVTLRHREVQQATCTERWTGSWYTMFLTVDRAGGLPVDADFEAEIRAHLERFRMAGHDLEIAPPSQVALEVVVSVCVLPDYYRADVEQDVLAALGSGRTPEGTAQFFHPDNLTFGTPVFLSALLAAVQAVEGVRYAGPLTFQRLGVPASSGLESGVLTFAPLEIPRLDNDPNFADRGTLRLEMEGGR
ncbi:putative baseplate assembly protein [Geodermatophilus sp. SYSU D01180]